MRPLGPSRGPSPSLARLRLLALAAALVLAAGCFRTDGGGGAQNVNRPEGVKAASPLACDPTYPDVYYSGNAPLQSLFQKSEFEVAKAFVQALGDALQDGENTTTDGSDTYFTTRGILRVSHDATGPSWRYTTQYPPSIRNGNESLAYVLAVLELAGVTDAVRAHARSEGNANGFVVILTQRVDPGTAGKGVEVVIGQRDMLFTLYPWFNLTGARVTRTIDEATSIARAFIDCEREKDPAFANETLVFLQASPAGFQVRHDSLAMVVGLTYGPSGEQRCGQRVDLAVLVDAVTGAIHEWRKPPCL